MGPGRAEASGRPRRLSAVVTVIALLGVVLAGQAAADSTAAVDVGEAEERGTEEVFGDAGFAYLTGLRRFGAALMWNRLDPLHHEYYEVGLSEQTFLLPYLRMITWFDPEFEQAYFVGAWVVARNDEIDEALTFAAEGVEHNPRSGELRSSYAQLLYLYGDSDEAVEQADMALEADYVDLVRRWESYGILIDIYRAAGLDERAAELQAEREHIDEEIHRRGIEHDDHDHDHGHDHDHEE